MTFIRTMLFFPLLFLFYCGKSVPEFNAERSFQYLEKQVEFGPRNPGSTSHDACRKWLVNKLKSYTERVVEQ